MLFRILRKCESSTPFWKKSLTWSEKNTSLNFEHQAGLDESSLTNRVSKLWTLPLSIQQTRLTIIATWPFSRYLQYIQFLIFTGWLSYSFSCDLPFQRFRSSLCAVHSLYTTHVWCISKTLDLVGSLRSTFPEYWFFRNFDQKKASSKTSLIYWKFTANSLPKRVTRKFQIQLYFM